MILQHSSSSSCCEQSQPDLARSSCSSRSTMYSNGGSSTSFHEEEEEETTNQPFTRRSLNGNSSNRTLLPRNNSSGRLRRGGSLLSRTLSGDGTGSSKSLLRNDSSKSLSKMISKSLSMKSSNKEDNNNNSSSSNNSISKRGPLKRNHSGGSNSLKSLQRSFSALGSSRSLRSLGDSTRSLTRSFSMLSTKDDEPEPEPEKTYLLDQLGGMIVLKSIVQEFGRRVIRDPLLQPLLAEADPRALNGHHERFFAMAFTEIVDVDQTAFTIKSSHQMLFAKGLNEEHYDVFQQHLVDCLTDRGFGFAILNPVLEVLEPVRDIFQQAAEEYRNSSSSSSSMYSSSSSTRS